MAVLVTLVYLALQTRQSTMAIGAQLDAATVAANQNGLLAAATSNELVDARRGLYRGLHGEPASTRELLDGGLHLVPMAASASATRAASEL